MTKSSGQEPNLPPELWSIVFREATFIPDLLFIDDLATLDDKYYHPENGRRYLESMRVKKSLVTVCRAWYALAIRFLYEDVRLGTTWKLERFLKVASAPPTFASSGIDNNEQAPTVGHLVNNLDVRRIAWLKWHVKDDEGRYHAFLDGKCQPIVQLLRLLPNLIALSLTSDHQPWTNDLIPIANIFPRTLQAVRCNHLSFKLSPFPWIAFLDALPNIQYLYPPHLACYDAKDSKDAQDALAMINSEGKTYPSLRHLVCHTTWACGEWYPAMPPSVFPNLRTVQYEAPPPVGSLTKFLAVHGQNLTMVHFHNCTTRSDISDWVSVVQTHCPDLTELRVGVRYPIPTTYGDFDFSYPGVNTFGIQYTSVHPNSTQREILRALVREIFFFMKAFPNLRRMMILGDPNAAAFREVELADLALPLFQECSFCRIEVTDRFTVPVTYQSLYGRELPLVPSHDPSQS